MKLVLISKIQQHKQLFTLKKKTYFKILSLSACVLPVILFATITFTFRGNLQSSDYTSIGDSPLTSIISEKEISRISDFSTIESKKELDNLDKEDELGFAFYRIKSGENLSSVAEKFGLSMSTVLSLNTLDNAHSVSVGQKVLLSTRSGIIFSLTNDESVTDITERYGISEEHTIALNQLDSKSLHAGKTIFLPDANFSFKAMSEILGFQFINPMPGYRRLSSHFGWRRHPVLGYRRLHAGTDFAGAIGATIVAAKEGRVIYAGWNGGHGLYIKIRHANGFTTSYSHLSKITIKNGDWVNTGQRIGRNGNTGLSTGPHLHFELHKYGQPINAVLNGLQIR